ncbi:DUF58 domain-containing protein [Robertkochia solimangrovi]|uniref:DUF58 domain-containing protein n=1 Tax=Robertkochia solimangrovi TaxID=2213046 RepID=UPI00117CC324|nr:DUF58 domain-containing protein [Robertkochia solimangrovi]TRZ42009.1 DUF58 domain-containing protein [Robertkochia solimangrovi]
MSKEDQEYPADIFISLKEMLHLEHTGKNISLLARNQPVNSVLGGRHASRIRGRGLDFEEVRTYVNGDDVRTIDWKVTARTKKTHVRVYKEEKEKPVFIVVDQSKSMFFGSVKKTKAVVAAEIAAIIAFSILNDGDRVGGMVFSDDGTDIVFPKRDRRNIMRFLETIEMRNHQLRDSDPVDFEVALKEATQRIFNLVTHDFLVIIISDFFRQEESFLKSLARISRHNDVILAKVSDPLEIKLPDTDVIFGDRQQQVSLISGQDNLRGAYQEAMEKEINQFRDRTKKYRIPVLEFNTAIPIDKQLKDQLSKKR